MGHKNYFRGRVVFDHLQKTAGQAVNAWLTETLGTGSVTVNLGGLHRALIRQYGGEFPVISGHMLFKGEGLDPRYQYLTLLRDPVDRTLSWITFLLHDVPRTDDTAPLIDGADRFLESDGSDATREFLDSISNPYIDHFSSISAEYRAFDDARKFSAAVSAIRTYDVIGLYEDLPSFLSECASALGMAGCPALPSVNRSSKSLSRDMVSSKLLRRIQALNALDIRFYDEVAGLIRERRGLGQTIPHAAETGWERYDTPPERYHGSAKLKLHAAHIRGGCEIACGATVNIELDFSLYESVEELEVGILVVDAGGQAVFGTNTGLLGAVQRNMRPGNYHATYLLDGHLPEGMYTVIFGFSEVRSGKRAELAWHGGLCAFTVRRRGHGISVGSMNLPARIQISEVSAGGRGHINRLARLGRRMLALALIRFQSVKAAAHLGARWS